MASLAGADAYFEPTLRWPEWNGHDDDQQQRAINDAASMLSRLSFSARPPTQAMDNAAYEQAYCLLDMPTETQQRVQAIASGLKSFSNGKYSESYQDTDKTAILTDGMLICPAALSWVTQYIRPKTGAKSGRLLFGKGCM